MPRFDLAIVGGGPAGSAAAWTAARAGLSVALYEQGRFPRDKVCGEFISAEAVPLLQAMIPETLREAPRVAWAQFSARHGGVRRFPLPAAAVGLSRVALDQALWEAAGVAGCTRFIQTKVKELSELDAAHTLVTAGRWWRIGGLPAPPTSPWIGVKARFLGMPPPTAVEMYVFPGGYCGLAPVEDGLTNACCLVQRRMAAPADDFAAWIIAASGHGGLACRLRTATQASPTQATAPVGIGPRCAVWGGVLFAGDASGFLDPVAGDGLARALLSGQLAAECVAAGEVEAYPRRLRHAAGGGWRRLRWLRAAVSAPDTVQQLAVRALGYPTLAQRLVAATRWAPSERPL